MEKIDFKNITPEQRKYITDTLCTYPDDNDKEGIAKKNEVVDLLVAEYPFLLPRNRFSDEVQNEDNGHRWCELCVLPEGWIKGFGLDFVRELHEAVLKSGKYDEFRVCQWKEKYGSGRFYNSFDTEETSNVITKYELISEHTCIDCGAPAKWVSTGWISPYCDECKKRMEADDSQYHERFEDCDSWFGKLGEDRFCVSYGGDKTGEKTSDGKDMFNHDVERRIWDWDKSCWKMFSKMTLTDRANDKRHEFFKALENLKDEKVDAILKQYESYVD